MPAARLLTPDDADAYVALRREMLLDAPWAFLASPGDDRVGAPDFLREMLSRPEGVIVGAFEGDRLRAVAGVMREGKVKRQHLASIWGVYTTPTARGGGLARMVTVAALATARRWPGVLLIQLTVSEHPEAAAARRLYASLGFVAWGTEPDAAFVEGQLFAETHLSLALGPSASLRPDPLE